MTQCQAQIKGPSVNILTRVIVDDGGLWGVWISVTLPAMHAGMEIHPTVDWPPGLSGRFDGLL